VGIDNARERLTIKPIVATWAGHRPSAARALSSFEAEQLAATARALPEDWVVVVEPPHGQLAITPNAGRHGFHRCWVASGALRRISRDLSHAENRPGRYSLPGRAWN
jgi:hypothetical protein